MKVTTFIQLGGKVEMNNVFNGKNQQNNIGDGNTNIMNNSSEINIEKILQLFNQLESEIKGSTNENLLPLIDDVKSEVKDGNIDNAKSIFKSIPTILTSSKTAFEIAKMFGLM